MTPSERAGLHRRISERIEPFDTLPKCFGIDSPLKAWRSELVGCIPYKKRGEWAWQPRDWTGDETASAMLLDLMANNNAYVWIEWDINEWCVTWKPTTTESYEDASIEYNHADRKTAVALAADKWLTNKTENQ